MLYMRAYGAVVGRLQGETAFGIRRFHLESRILPAAAADQLDPQRARPTSGTGRGVEGSALTCQHVIAAVGRP